MYQQTNNEINVFRRFSCYGLSIGRIAEQHIGKLLTPEEIWMVYALAVTKGYMKPNYFLLHPAKIMNLYFDILGYPEFRASCPGWWNRDTGEEFWLKKEYTNTVYRHDTASGGYHFRLKEWDPWEGLDLVMLSGKRYFKVVKK